MAKITEKSMRRAQNTVERLKIKKKIDDLQGKLLQTSDQIKRAELKLDIKQLKFQRQQMSKA